MTPMSFIQEIIFFALKLVSFYTERFKSNSNDSKMIGVQTLLQVETAY